MDDLSSEKKRETSLPVYRDQRRHFVVIRPWDPPNPALIAELDENLNIKRLRKGRRSDQYAIHTQFEAVVEIVEKIVDSRTLVEARILKIIDRTPLRSVPPTLEEFALTQEQIGTAGSEERKYESQKRTWYFVTYLVLILALIFSGLLKSFYPLLSKVGWILFPISLLVFWLIFDLFFKKAHPKPAFISKTHEYEAAQKAHQNYLKACEEKKRKETREWWFELSGSQFEAAIELLFRSKGHSIQRVGGSNDGGVDLVLIREDGLCAIQCKAHKKAASPNFIREIIGTVQAKGFQSGMVICLGGFTSAAKALAADNNILLWDIDDVVKAQKSQDNG